MWLPLWMALVKEWRLAFYLAQSSSHYHEVVLPGCSLFERLGELFLREGSKIMKIMDWFNTKAKVYPRMQIHFLVYLSPNILTNKFPTWFIPCYCQKEQWSHPFCPSGLIGLHCELTGPPGHQDVLHRIHYHVAEYTWALWTWHHCGLGYLSWPALRLPILTPPQPARMASFLSMSLEADGAWEFWTAVSSAHGSLEHSVRPPWLLCSLSIFISHNWSCPQEESQQTHSELLGSYLSVSPPLSSLPLPSPSVLFLLLLLFLLPPSFFFPPAFSPLISFLCGSNTPRGQSSFFFLPGWHTLSLGFMLSSALATDYSSADLWLTGLPLHMQSSPLEIKVGRGWSRGRGMSSLSISKEALTHIGGRKDLE